MLLETARFGCVEYSARDIVLFPGGLIGFEQLHAWLLLAEQPLVWLQAVEDSQVALPLVSPFRYVPEYRAPISAADYRELDLDPVEPVTALGVVARDRSHWTLNLRAPIIVWPNVRLGKQVVLSEEQPLRYVLPRSGGTLRKSA
jgi:flagellar assembly factor FliW